MDREPFYQNGEMWQVGYIGVCGDEHKVGPEEGELWIFLPNSPGAPLSLGFGLKTRSSQLMHLNFSLSFSFVRYVFRL
jgi:hypothetical protein